MPNKRVLVIDDSSTIRAMISQVFESARDIKVVGMISNTAEAQDAIDRLRPDVLTLDIAMPGVDGLTFLGQIMRRHPIPVIILSSASTPGSETTRQALALGASACFDKSKLLSQSKALIDAVTNAKRGKPLPPSGVDPAQAVVGGDKRPG